MTFFKNRRIKKLKCLIAQYEAKSDCCRQIAQSCTRLSEYHDRWIRYSGLEHRYRKELEVLTDNNQKSDSTL